MTFPPFPGPPDPAALAKVREFQDAAIAHDIAWRRTITGPWAFLWCSCREPGPERCPVHGSILVTPDGEVL